MDETREQEASVEERPWSLRPGDKNLSCDTSRKNLAKLPMVQRCCGAGHRDLGPDPQQQQRLPRRGKLRLSTLQTLFCQQQAHAFTPQLSLENKIKLFKIIHKSINKLGKIVDFLPQVSFLPVHN